MPGFWVLFALVQEREKTKSLAQEQLQPPPVAGLLSESEELMMVMGPVPGSDFLQVVMC